MRLIDADDLDFFFCDSVFECSEQVAFAETIDAVPVVRCRCCVHSFGFTDADGNKKLLCTEIGRRGIDPDGFCSYGKRSEY